MNKLIIAAAGAGKTTYLVKEALKKKDEVLITTYTEANEKEIRKKFIEINGFIPQNITIQTWFSMLIQHGVKPYQDYLTNKKINGMILVNQQSSPYVKATNVDKYYFNSEHKIYSDKLPKFVTNCNEISHGAIIDRLSIIYQNIFIDEVQDLAGYDLEIIRLLFESSSNILLVGDPRQVTYLTHHERKFSKYKNGKIKEFIEEECSNLEVEIDEASLSCSYRNNELICTFSARLYTEYSIPTSSQNIEVEHKGIFFVKENDIDDYMQLYNPVQLRDSRKKKITNNFPVMNFGESKGLGFDRILIYPTKPILKWILNGESLNPISCSKLYVAITRAKHSVGIVYNYPIGLEVDTIQNWTK